MQAKSDEADSISAEFKRTAMDRTAMVQAGFDSYLNGGSLGLRL
jgi:hypothetical protein